MGELMANSNKSGDGLSLQQGTHSLVVGVMMVSYQLVVHTTKVVP